MPDKIKVMIAEDHKLVREGVMSLLKEEKGISVIGDAENGKELLELIDEKEPDVVLLDLEMPVMDGIKTLAVLSKRFPKIKVIILSMYYSEEMVKDLLTKGASAYLPKACDHEILSEAIHSVLHDTYYFENTNTPFKPAPVNLSFTEKEIEIMKEICKGKTNKEIAVNLQISGNTVDFHRKNIYVKAEVNNAAMLTLYAVRNKIISTHGQSSFLS
jgi:two-component system response regulator NreC